jgi:hypothetical protein
VWFNRCDRGPLSHAATTVLAQFAEVGHFPTLRHHRRPVALPKPTICFCTNSSRYEEWNVQPHLATSMVRFIMCVVRRSVAAAQRTLRHEPTHLHECRQPINKLPDPAFETIASQQGLSLQIMIAARLFFDMIVLLKSNRCERQRTGSGLTRFKRRCNCSKRPIGGRTTG